MEMQVSEAALRDFLLVSGGLPRRTLEELAGQGPLGEVLVAQGYLSQDELRRAEAHLLGVPFVEILHDTLDHDALFLIPEPLARAHNVVAYRTRPGEVEVALLNLEDLEQLHFLQEQRLKVLPRLTTASSIKRSLIIYQKKLKEQFSSLAKGGAHAAEGLLRHALLSRASSVHLDFKTAGLLVRYRIKGLLHEAFALPRTSVELVARLKEWARLSPTLHVPQEGGFKVDLSGGESLRVRVHSAPVHAGERLVLHLFPSTTERGGFTPESLGLHGEGLENMHKLLHLSQGLVVVAGPSESGVTTLLYTLTDALSMAQRAVVTVEDEIEYTLPHVTQLKVRSEVGLTVAATLRAALRQDPDVVVVGRVASAEVAELAERAARRGVLVYAGTASPDLFNEAQVRGTVSTRLVRRVCPNCKESYKLSRQESGPFENLADFGRVLAALKEEGVVGEEAQWKELAFARASQGCKECEGGYKGLVGLQEVKTHGEAPLTLIEDGLFKAVAGLTSIEEVVRVATEG